jgi:hypothetical protein
MNERWAPSLIEPAKESALQREDDRPGPASATPSAQQVFGRAGPSADAVVVYKRRRLPLAPETADAAAAAEPERGPRVFQVAPSGADADAGADGAAGGDLAAASPAAESTTPIRRRRRRNAQQSPGEVRHIVFERPPAAAAGLASSDYRAAWQALQAVGRTLEQIRTAQRIKALLDELPF